MLSRERSWLGTLSELSLRFERTIDGQDKVALFRLVQAFRQFGRSGALRSALLYVELQLINLASCWYPSNEILAISRGWLPTTVSWVAIEKNKRKSNAPFIVEVVGPVQCLQERHWCLQPKQPLYTASLKPLIPGNACIKMVTLQGSYRSYGTSSILT